MKVEAMGANELRAYFWTAALWASDGFWQRTAAFVFVLVFSLLAIRESAEAAADRDMNAKTSDPSGGRGQGSAGVQPAGRGRQRPADGRSPIPTFSEPRA